MPVVAMTGKDVLKINGRIITQQQNGDVTVLEYPNDLAEVQTGKNGNSIYGYKYTGQQSTLELRVTRGGSDDAFFNDLINLFSNDPAAFVLMNGEFVKNIGDGAGNIKSDIYILSGGVFKKKPGSKENADGDPEQATTIYNLIFSNCVRVIG